MTEPSTEWWGDLPPAIDIGVPPIILCLPITGTMFALAIGWEIVEDLDVRPWPLKGLLQLLAALTAGAIPTTIWWLILR